LLATLSTQATGASVPADSFNAAVSQEASKAQIDYLDAVVLGLVEGLTEYLPVSSTGHLILANELLGLNAETVLLGRDGQPVMIHDEALPTGQRPFSLKDAADGYAIIIQAGAIAAVALIYWSRLMGALRGSFSLGFAALGVLMPAARHKAHEFDRTDTLLARNLIVAFMPAAVIGLLLDDWIERALFGVGPVVVALVAGAFLMLGVEHWRRRRHATPEPRGPDLHELSLRQCLTIGLLQCVAMWPGTSRSMMTLVGGYVVGLSPVRAAEFSFLLGFITLTAASGYKALKVGGPMLETLPLGPMLVGIFVATVSAALAVKWLVSYLTRHGLALFAWYRLGLAACVIAFL
jgi:undecaprenyl-diphosphatase